VKVNVESVLWVDRQVEPLREKTVKVLREAILSEHLKPGQQLVERELCQQTGVSRSSIREALRYLESEGLVESRGTKGIFVAVLTVQQALEIYEVRAALEAEAARHFVKRATDKEIAALRTCLLLIKKVASKDADAYGRGIDHFFEILFAGARNATAHAIMRSLGARINFLRRKSIRTAPKSRIPGSLAKMSLIYEALAKRDGEAAAAACRAFVARSAEFAERSVVRALAEAKAEGENFGQPEVHHVSPPIWRR
jgi:DNA-binding GntR family transcriptional regulator